MARQEEACWRCDDVWTDAIGQPSDARHAIELAFQRWATDGGSVLVSERRTTFF